MKRNASARSNRYSIGLVEQAAQPRKIAARWENGRDYDRADKGQRVEVDGQAKRQFWERHGRKPNLARGQGPISTGSAAEASVMRKAQPPDIGRIADCLGRF